jgi:hypothetical protein
MSPVLVGVPSLVGLSWSQAVDAASGRGLVLQRDGAGFTSIPMFVTTQDPTAPALAARGSSVAVTLSAKAGSPLAVRVRPGRASCAARGCVLRLRVELSSSALVRSRLLSGRGRLLSRGVLGTLHAGSNTVRVKLPRRIGKGAYRLLLDASGGGRRAHALVHVKVG